MVVRLPPFSAPQLRVLLDCAHASGLRASELVHATLGAVEVDHEQRWLHVIGKGNRSGRLMLLPPAYSGRKRYITQRGLPTRPRKWSPDIPVVGKICGEAGLNRDRMWVVMKRFFGSRPLGCQRAEARVWIRHWHR